MATIIVNEYCRIKTEEDSQSRSNPQITIGKYRMRLYMKDARLLVSRLTEAIAKVEEMGLEG